NAHLDAGIRYDLTDVDLRVMDVIGYDRVTSEPTPAPRPTPPPQITPIPPPPPPRPTPWPRPTPPPHLTTSAASLIAALYAGASPVAQRCTTKIDLKK